jgi:hypothetical protein
LESPAEDRSLFCETGRPEFNLHFGSKGLGKDTAHIGKRSPQTPGGENLDGLV